jgi:hypothetical protein
LAGDVQGHGRGGFIGAGAHCWISAYLSRSGKLKSVEPGQMDSHDRRAARSRDAGYAASEVAAKYGVSVAKDTDEPDEAYADWPGEYMPVQLPWPLDSDAKP